MSSSLAPLERLEVLETALCNRQFPSGVGGSGGRFAPCQMRGASSRCRLATHVLAQAQCLACGGHDFPFKGSHGQHRAARCHRCYTPSRQLAQRQADIGRCRSVARLPLAADAVALLLLLRASFAR